MDLGRLQLSMAQPLFPQSRALLIEDYIRKRIKLETEFTLKLEQNKWESPSGLSFQQSFIPNLDFYSKLIQFQRSVSIISESKESQNLNTNLPPPALTRKEDISNNSAEEESESVPKKSIKGSASKNYIALLCTGFARTILGANQTDDVWSKISHIAKEKKKKFKFIELEDDDLVEYFKRQIIRDFCGKKLKKTTNSVRDFKIRNTEELNSVLTVEDDESDIVKFKKECFKELFNYFFNSKLYIEWLNNGMINQVNKSFFIVNKDELQKKFQNPNYYKPKFIHDSEEEEK